jgi:hypothetical protein
VASTAAQNNPKLRLEPDGQLFQAVGAIEQGIPGVPMQMDKIGVRHGDNLMWLGGFTKRQSFRLI